LERKIVPVVTGFIGATSKGKPTTLGRGGSDYTASVLGVCINATEIWIWTDVDGMMSADPRDIEEARVIPSLSYEEAAELAYFGARILHTRMIGPLSDEKIPLRIKNVYKPQQAGTLISDTTLARSRTLKAITSISGLAVEAKRSGEFSPIPVVYDKAVMAAPNSQLDIILSAQSATRSLACFLIPTTAGPDAIHTIRLTMEENLQANPLTQNWVVKNITFVTAISANLDSWPTVTAAIMQRLKHLHVLAFSYGPSNSSFTLVVENKEAEEALSLIHEMVISNG
jgi:aspartate kinase